MDGELMGKSSNKAKVIDAHTLLKLIGAMAFLLPVILVLGNLILSGCTEIQSSISKYYYTIMRNYFVGTLCTVGVCMFAYEGYEQQDDIFGDIAAVLVILIAFLPTSEPEFNPPCNQLLSNSTPLTATLHLILSGGFFMILSYFCLILFVKHEGNPTPEKLKRNKIYRFCGVIMLGCIALLILLFTISTLKQALKPVKPIFILETVALFAFGVAWLVKGEIILKDKEDRA